MTYRVLTGSGIEWATNLPTIMRARAAACLATRRSALNVRIVDENGTEIERGTWVKSRGGGMMNIPH